MFGKVSIATSISAAIGTVGVSLGGGYTADTDTFSPVLASTFVILFDESVQTRMGVSEYGVNNFDDEVLLEDSSDQFGELLLNGTDSSSTDAGYKLVSETLHTNFLDFEGISITHGVEAGDFGVLLGEGDDGFKIISENTEAISNILLINSTPDSNHTVSTDTGSAFL